MAESQLSSRTDIVEQVRTQCPPHCHHIFILSLSRDQLWQGKAYKFLQHKLLSPHPKPLSPPWKCLMPLISWDILQKGGLRNFLGDHGVLGARSWSWHRLVIRLANRKLIAIETVWTIRERAQLCDLTHRNWRCDSDGDSSRGSNHKLRDSDL